MYFVSFEGPPDIWLIEQIPKPITHHKYIIQDFDSMVLGTYCLYSLYLCSVGMRYEDIVREIYLSEQLCFTKDK